MCKKSTRMRANNYLHAFKQTHFQIHCISLYKFICATDPYPYPNPCPNPNHNPIPNPNPMSIPKPNRYTAVAVTSSFTLVAGASEETSEPTIAPTKSSNDDTTEIVPTVYPSEIVPSLYPTEVRQNFS